MYWLGPQRYLRVLGAAALLAVALYAEFRPTGTVEHPFATASISRGEPITSIEWREVPRGLLVAPHLSGSSAAVDILPDEPILESHIAPSHGVPGEWWSIPVPMPFLAPAGTSVRLVDAETGRTTDGIVTVAPPDDPFAVEPAALIAVPAGEAAHFAVAAASGQVTVLVAGA